MQASYISLRQRKRKDQLRVGNAIHLQPRVARQHRHDRTVTIQRGLVHGGHHLLRKAGDDIAIQGIGHGDMSLKSPIRLFFERQMCAVAARSK